MGRNSALNSALKADLHVFGEMCFVLHPGNPRHSATIINNNSSPVVLHSKYLTTKVKVSNSEKQ